MIAAQSGTRPILLAAGGTGGHMFPAEATARELTARNRRICLVTDRRGTDFGDADGGISVFRIDAPRLGGGLLGKVLTAFRLVRAYRQARRILKDQHPAAVVGFGGYASAPTAFAATRIGVPLVLHEQNAILGRANRLLAPRAAGLAVSFPQVRGVRAEDGGKVTVTGNPVRPEIAALRDTAYDPPGDDGAFRLLILGGSQGAKIFSEIVPEALGRLPPDLQARLDVTQQCRHEDLPTVEATYTRRAIRHTLASFFTDVPERLRDTHLAICRAGASTVAELSAVGRPAILVPFPFATDDHQTANGDALASAGGAVAVAQSRLTPEGLAERLTALMRRPDDLVELAAGARTWGRTDAAQRLADEVLRLADPTAPAAPQGAGSAPAGVAAQ